MLDANNHIAMAGQLDRLPGILGIEPVPAMRKQNEGIPFVSRSDICLLVGWRSDQRQMIEKECWQMEIGCDGRRKNIGARHPRSVFVGWTDGSRIPYLDLEPAWSPALFTGTRLDVDRVNFLARRVGQLITTCAHWIRSAGARDGGNGEE